MTVTTTHHETHTFRMQPLGQVFGGIVMVATAVVLAAVIGAQTAQSIVFRALFGLGCLLYAWFGERLARARVQVHDGRLIAHDYLRTRTVNASDIREITYDVYRSSGTRWLVPRVHLAGGGSIRLSGLWSRWSRRAELATIVEEILSLLGVHLPVEGRPPAQAPAQAPDSSLPGVDVPAHGQPPAQPSGEDLDRSLHVLGVGGPPHEPSPRRLPDKAPARGSRKRVARQSAVGLPADSVGAPRPPRPPRQFRKELRNALPVLLGLTLGVLYIFSATVRVLVILLYCGLALLSLIRLMTGSRRNRSSRARPTSSKSS